MPSCDSSCLVAVKLLWNAGLIGAGMYESCVATNSLTISKLLGPACFQINTRLSFEEAISMSPVMFQCTLHTSTCLSLSRRGIG